jgi:hypothetical protein
MKNSLSSLLIGLAVVLASVVLATAFVHRNKTNQQISVTGLGTYDFTSDLVVWKGRFTRLEQELSIAYDQLDQDRTLIRTYLMDQGLQEDEFFFSAISIDKEYSYSYDQHGNRVQSFDGYRLFQGIEIESSNVDKIEALSRDISTIIQQGIEFSSDRPQYYYTQLSELKIEMIAQATADGRVRAEQIAQNSNAELGKLKNARMGVFQIIGKNSNEDYSWGGSFNTSSKEKTATITMKLEFAID